MKLSLWHKGHHINIEGTKDEIMEFLDGLEQPEITFTPSETYSLPAYWGGYQHTEDQRTNPDVSISGFDFFIGKSEINDSRNVLFTGNDHTTADAIKGIVNH